MEENITIDLKFDESTKTNGKYLIFDTETTGFPIKRHASVNDFKNWPYIVQIAWILFDDEHKAIELQNFYIKQPVEIPADATKIHGITTAMMLEKGIEPSTVYANFKKAIDNTEYIIAHNIDFDIPVVRCDFLRNGMQWDFPNDRMLCTMKTGTNFCKIQPLGIGEYKWPKLIELYQKCFYPDHQMKFCSDDSYTNQMIHSAITDAAMTAQCFFKLKDLGYFKEFKTKTTTNSLSNVKTDGNDLHRILDNWSSNEDKWGRPKWQWAKIEHLGLGVSCSVRDEWKEEIRHQLEPFSRENVITQFKKWDQQWAIKVEKEANLNNAEERTLKAKDKQKQIEDLLVYALGIDNTINWESLKDKKKIKVPQFVADINSFNANIKEQYEQKIKVHEDTIEKLQDNYFHKNTEAIVQCCQIVLNNSQYPETFPKKFDLDYDSENKTLILDYILPAPENFPTLTTVKYIASTKEFKESFISKTSLSKIYDDAIYKITLRTLHELFEADKAEALEAIVFNGWVSAIDKAIGKQVTNCIVTIQVNKAEFNEIELSKVDAKACFNYLKGIGSRNLASITAVNPIVKIIKKN